MVKPVKLGKTVRQSFSKINELLDMPNLIEIQKAIDNFNFTKVFDILAEVNQYESEKEISNLFTKISHLMDDLAVEEVSDIIKSYL